DDMRNLQVGKPAPEIEGPDLDGRRMKLSDYRSKVVLLVFWATWCGPCMEAVPEEKKIHEQFKGRRFVMLGVDGDNDIEAARQTALSHQMPWRSWRDPFEEEDGFGPIRKRYHTFGIPRLFLIDANGVIRNRELRPSEISAQVGALLDEFERAPI